MKLVNLTPHPVRVLVGGEWQEVPPSGPVLRCPERVMRWETQDGVEIQVKRLSAPALLPPPEEGALYIVSLPALMALRVAGVDRPDIVAPTEYERDEQGRIVGARALMRLA